VLAFWLFALRLALRVFMVIVQASVTNALAVCVGPVFMAAAAFHQTRRYAYGWLAIIASALTTQLLASAALTLVTGALHEIFRNILVAAKAHTFAPIVTGGVDDLGDIMNMVAGLMIAAAVIFVCGHIFETIPSMGQSIAGGIRHHAPGADTVANAPAAMASAAAGAIAGTSFGQAVAASGVGRAASAMNSMANRLRSAGSAGRSLSRS
jgi:type IV secretory pathway VirB6-like protein